MSLNKIHSQRTLSQSAAPQFAYLHRPLRLSVAPQSSQSERPLSLSAALQLNPHAVPFIPQEMRVSKEYNSSTVPQVTSALNPSAVPFVSSNSIYSVSMTAEGSGLTCSMKKQATIKGQKRKLGEPKEEDAVFCKAHKENEQGEPPRKKHCSISIAESYPRPCTFLQQESSNQVGEQVKESKSSSVKQQLDGRENTNRVKRAGTSERAMRAPLRPITNKAKVQKHNDSLSRNAKKTAMTAAKEAERMKREEEKRKEKKKRRERSLQIDIEAMERRRVMAQQQRMLDDDVVARARFLREYAERIAFIKKERSMNRTYKKLSPCYHRWIYNIYRKSS